MEITVLFIIMLAAIALVARRAAPPPPPVIVIQTEPIADTGSMVLRVIIVVAVFTIIAGVAML